MGPGRSICKFTNGRKNTKAVVQKLNPTVKILLSGHPRPGML